MCSAGKPTHLGGYGGATPAPEIFLIVDEKWWLLVHFSVQIPLTKSLILLLCNW